MEAIYISITVELYTRHCPSLDHIFIRLGHVSSTPPSLPGLLRGFLIGNQCDNKHRMDEDRVYRFGNGSISTQPVLNIVSA